MNDRKAEIRQANRKALPKFILFTLACTLVGGMIGFSAAWLGIEGLTDGLKQIGAHFARYGAPWLMIALAILRPAVCIPLYRGAKKLLSGWDGEDEDLSERIDRRVSTIMWLNNLFNVVSFFLFGAAFSIGVFAAKELGPALFWATLLAFCGGLFEGLMLERRTVDITKQIYPEKNGSVYDFSFQKKWMASCDEAEKLMIGQCAYKAYRAVSSACMVLWIILTLAAMFFDTGFLPVLVVCIIWGVSLCVYTHWSIKLSKAGSITL